MRVLYSPLLWYTCIMFIVNVICTAKVILCLCPFYVVVNEPATPASGILYLNFGEMSLWVKASSLTIMSLCKLSVQRLVSNWIVKYSLHHSTRLLFCFIFCLFHWFLVGDLILFVSLSTYPCVFSSMWGMVQWELFVLLHTHWTGLRCICVHWAELKQAAGKLPRLCCCSFCFAFLIWTKLLKMLTGYLLFSSSWVASWHIFYSKYLCIEHNPFASTILCRWLVFCVAFYVTVYKPAIAECLADTLEQLADEDGVPISSLFLPPVVSGKFSFRPSPLVCSLWIYWKIWNL